MKPIQIALAPTRSRPLNILLGLMLVLVALLGFLALATYHPTDPSWNTASGAVASHTVCNWVGLFGAWLGDLLLQTLGITAFFLPLWLGGLGWTWMRSRPGGSPWLRWMGTFLALVFFPAVLGLVPWNWRWLHAVPVEGLVGKLMAGLLVTYLNIQGALLVAGVLAGTGLWFASSVSFWAIKEGAGDRWLQFLNLRDRWRNWREERAERREEKLAELEVLRFEASPKESGPQLVSPRLIPDPEPEVASAEESQPGFFARLFRR